MSATILLLRFHFCRHLCKHLVNCRCEMGRSVLLRHSAFYQHAARCTAALDRERVLSLPSFFCH